MADTEIHIAGGEIDTHFHSLHVRDRGLDVRAVLGNCFESGLKACVDIGISEQDIDERYDLLGDLPRVYFAHGLYPSNADRDDLESALSRVEDALSRARTVALGEIGMDLFRGYATPELQRSLLVRQIQVANEHNLPVIIHNREAEESLLEAFAECRPERESVMHCYSGPSSYVPRFLDLGFSFSFGGNVTFKNAQSVRDAMIEIPLDRLLLETDAPYLAPHPRRGRTNHPGLVGHTYEHVAGVRGIARADLVHAAAANAARIFGI